MAAAKKDSKPLPYLAAILAWLVPGAGHIYIGRRTRGIIIFVTIAATFWTGVAFGGVMTVDYQNQRWWFAAEMCAGMHGLVAWYRQHMKYDDMLNQMLSDDEFQQERADCQTRSELILLRRAYMDKVRQESGVALVAPTETVARAYAGVAGLLNVMCIFDAMILSLMGVSGEPTRGKNEGTAT